MYITNPSQKNTVVYFEIIPNPSKKPAHKMYKMDSEDVESHFIALIINHKEPIQKKL